jgi:hypothetical protein
MSDAFGLDLAAEIAALLYSGVDVTAPTSVFVKLHDGDPGSDGTTNELDSGTTAPGYGPVEVSVPSGFDQGADTTELTNAIRVEDFGPATGDWPEVTHFSVWTTSDQSGRVLFEDAFTDPKTVVDGDPVVIAQGNMTTDILE